MIICNYYTSLSSIKDSLNQLRNTLDEFVSVVNSLYHDISKLKQQLILITNSNQGIMIVNNCILKSAMELNIFPQWIGVNYDNNLEQLYRGSACTFSVRLFHSKCTKILFIVNIHTVNDLTIRGFMWRIIKAFLFSLTNRRKYKINDPINAQNTLFIFFDQGDLIIHSNEIESYFQISDGELFQEAPLSLTNGNNILKFDEIEAFS